MAEQSCKSHRYGEPNQQGYVTCWVCGDKFNVADDLPDADEYERDCIDYGDDDESDDPEEADEENPICLTCGGYENSHRSGCPDDDDLWY